MRHSQHRSRSYVGRHRRQKKTEPGYVLPWFLDWEAWR